jgi:hypothetical protein
VAVTIHGLTTTVPVVEARSLPSFLRAPEREHDTCVVALRDGRPQTLLIRAAHGWRVVRTPLVVRADEPLPDPARRPIPERADPICCVDEHGLLLGMLFVEDVIPGD